MLREEEILERYESAPELERGDLLVALRETDGEPGLRLLWRVAHEPEPRDKRLRFVAVASLLVRRVDVTDDLIAGLSSRSTGEQAAAASMLAHRGDARACEPMLAWLQRKLRKKSRAATGAHDPWEIQYSVSCLARHDEGGTWLTRAGSLLRRSWDNIDDDEKAWLKEHWAGLFTEAEPVPLPTPAEIDKMTTWLRDDLEEAGGF